MTYPIIEHDPSPEAFIEPSKVIQPRDMPEHCVISFFREVIARVAARPDARIVVDTAWEDGPHPIYEIAHRGQRLAVFHPGVGAPLAAGLLEEVIAYGCRKFIACGGCGVLDKDIAVGNIILVSGAVRDEGTSYHYLPPEREIAAHPAAVSALRLTLDREGVPYRLGKTWTTDAPYRETPDRIARRKEEGCLTVEMESASLMAVAQFRRVLFGQALYGGDDLSGDQWDERGWQTREQVRESLFWLCADACLAL